MNDRAYTKLFSKIVTSSMWGEDSDTRVVWVTMMALQDAYGEIHAALPGLARAANVPLEKCGDAIKKFLAPDEWSRSKEFEGRRIVEIEGGWRLLNAQKYRDLMSTEERREYKRVKEAERRARIKSDRGQTVDNHGQTVADRGQKHANKEEEEETKEKVQRKEAFSLSNSKARKPAVKFTKPTVEEVREYCMSRGLPASDGDAFFGTKETTAWKDVKNWQAAIRHWQSEGWMKSQKLGPQSYQKAKTVRGLDGKFYTEQEPTLAHDEWGRPWQYDESGARLHCPPPNEDQI